MLKKSENSKAVTVPHDTAWNVPALIGRFTPRGSNRSVNTDIPKMQRSTPTRLKVIPKDGKPYVRRITKLASTNFTRGLLGKKPIEPRKPKV